MKLGPGFDRWLTTPPEYDEEEGDDPVHAAGWMAAQDGYGEWSNPHPVGSQDWEVWREGYNDYMSFMEGK